MAGTGRRVPCCCRAARDTRAPCLVHRGTCTRLWTSLSTLACRPAGLHPALQYATDPEPIVADSCIVALDMLEFEQSGGFQYADDGSQPAAQLAEVTASA